MSLKSGSIIKKKEDKIIPKNKKYENTNAVTNTGFTMKKQLEQADENPDHPTTGELFKRIKPGSLVRLIFEEDELFNPNLITSQFDPSVEYSVDPSTPLKSSSSSLPSPSPIVPFDSSKSGTSAPLKQTHFLLLDVRIDDMYEDCHIKYAKHYPSIMLSRSMNSFTPDILACMNKADTKIVLYCNDERESARVATVMFQRGVDNVFVLTGGLRKVCAKYPEAVQIRDGKKAPFPVDRKLIQLRGDWASFCGGGEGIRDTASISTNSSAVSSASTQQYLEKKLGRPISYGSSSATSTAPKPAAPSLKKRTAPPSSSLTPSKKK